MKDCGTKTYGKWFSAIFEALEVQEQHENLFATSEVVVDIDLCCMLYVVASLYCNSENVIGRKAFDSTINLSLQLESSIK